MRSGVVPVGVRHTGLLDSAFAAFQEGRLAEAEFAVRQVLAEAPDEPRGLLLLGQVALAVGQPVPADALFSRVIGRRPAWADAHYHKGVCLVRLQRLDEAEASLCRALDLDPAHVGAALELGGLLRPAERFEDMVRILSGLLARHPDCADAALLRCEALMRLRRHDEAEACFRAAMAARPGHAAIETSLAALLIEKGNAGEALTLLNGVLAGAPDDEGVLYLKAVAVGMLGDRKESDELIDRVRSGMMRPVERRGLLPQEVFVQLSKRCNLRCTMCGHAGWQSNSGVMEPALFERVVDQCVAHGIGHMNILAGQGEPFLHPQIFELLESAVGRGLRVSVVTNGTPFTTERIARLAGLGLAHVQFSFAGWDKESYESVYVGAQFERTVFNLMKMNAALQGTGTAFSVKAVTVDTSPETVARCRAFLREIGIDRVTTVSPNNFGGTVDVGRHWPEFDIWSHRDLGKHRRTMCRLTLSSLGIFHDGRVTACGCYDTNAELEIGDITRQTIAEIRNGERFGAILDAFRKGDVADIPMCRSCDVPFE
ncbi:tetratricopeptide repeat protein [Magnetospirillum sp. SS-4]|uniref:tetratricopeptide repeat protein n=1 Tax=Magnetospirillum sp. SS-4 TaxID=2681465 RepID=UPI00137C90D1|nr:tetratricopeptide repeat protein [Magnetospirillum sp. SS-4]CAA7613664.1 Predicted Fe-S oxidoreductase (Modular protein) [Magnetospirillum sp. SS-4]